MIAFAILVIITSLMMRPIGGSNIKYVESEQIKDNPAWDFDSLDDCMEYAELRKTGWKGNAQDFYKWKEEK